MSEVRGWDTGVVWKQLGWMENVLPAELVTAIDCTPWTLVGISTSKLEPDLRVRVSLLRDEESAIGG